MYSLIHLKQFSLLQKNICSSRKNGIRKISFLEKSVTITDYKAYHKEDFC